MMTLSLAARNLLRNRRRSMSTLLALCIGSVAVLLFGGYSANIKYSMQTGYVRSGGHLQIQHKDFYLYGSGNPGAYGITEHDKLLKALLADPVLKPMVAVATPTLQFGGIAGNYAAGVSRTVIGSGLVAVDVNRMRLWNEFDLPMDTQRSVLEGASSDAAIVGVGVARVLQLCEPLAVADCPKPEAEKVLKGAALPDDIAALAESEKPQQTRRGKATIELLANNAGGAPNVAALNVLQTESQGFKELDEVAVIVQFAQAQQLVFGRSPPKASAIMVQLQHGAQIPAAMSRLTELLATAAPQQHLTVLDFETLNPFYVQTLQLFDAIFGFIFVLIGGIVLFTVSNTMNTAVIERTTEIGTLRAVGLRRSGIRRMFVTEGLLLGVAGALLGAIMALLIAWVVNHLNLTWLPPGSAEPLPLILRVWSEKRMLVGTTLGLIVIAAVSAWLPAYRAANLQVVEALRHT